MIRKLLNLILIFVCLSWGASRAWAAKDFNIKNNAQSFFYLNGTSGNVGIGSVTPGQKLDVQGTVRTVGFTMSGQTPVSGYVLTAGDSAGDTTWTSGGAVSGWTVSGNNVYESLGGNVGIGTTNITTAGLIVMNGNVGIGTWVPSTALYVNGAIGASNNILTNPTGSTTAAPRLFGFSPSFAAGQAAQIQFGDISNVLQNGYGDRMQLSAYWGIEVRGNVEGTAPAFVGGTAADAALEVFAPSTATSNTLSLVNGAGTVVYDVFGSTGNLGIGSLTPGQALDVQGTVRTTGFQLTGNGAGATNMMVSNAVGVGTWMATTTLPIAIVTLANTNDVTFYSATNAFSGGSGFQTNGTNVGIGTSGFTQASLQVVGNIGIGTVKNGDNFITASPPKGGIIVEGSVGIGTYNPSQLFEVGKQGFDVTSTGNVGIGTKAPSGALEIEGPNAGIGIGTAFTTTSAMTIMNGNVGIGTWIPSAKVQVSGQYNSVRVNNGNQPGASMTIDWNNGNVQAVTLTGAITTLTLNNPVAGGRYLLEIKQGGAGSFAIAWPASVNWPSGTAPTLTATAGQSDIITLYYNGSNYAGFYSLNYSI